ncbi:MAG TPA: OmpA family protein [Spirochaetota bacterium]|nr:OmpA family protein [Spirochaetota bacterium]HNT09332.1 OmpA family protein [Spirochaetota bacterium]HNV45532.1 OmpA family protein [Spirochaetota bacterium]HOS39156.1 OmpA family protein [Spirochaetota bacterium]HPI22305.1 OmpA family protein [Spirochaetota bacterium]
MGKKFEKSKQKGAPPWMVSMGDMNNLLMCFFIVLMGEDVVKTQAEDIQLIMSAIKGNVGIMDGGKTFARGKLAEMGHNLLSLPSTTRERTFAKGVKRAQELFRPEIRAKQVRVTEDERGLVISLSSDIYFDSGSSRLKPEAKPVLKKLSGLFTGITNFIRVEGHTDSRPIGTPGVREGFESNWDLSSARSISVVRYFIEDERVNPKQLSAVAFGQYRPIDDNNTPEGRALNRRVDIVILHDRMLQEGKDPRISRPLPDEEWR